MNEALLLVQRGLRFRLVAMTLGGAEAEHRIFFPAEQGTQPLLVQYRALY